MSTEAFPPVILGPSLSDYQSVARPVSVMAKEFANGATSGTHHHAHGQLLYCVSGVMEVLTDHAVWLVPPQRAVWLPSNVAHEMRCRGHVSLRTIYVRPDAIPQSFPVDPAIVQVSPLLRELILRAVAMPPLYDEAGRDGQIVELMLQEFAWERASLLMIHQPRDRRLAPIYQHLLRNPHSNLTIENWAGKLDVSSRTLARLFHSETGTSFIRWRQQIRLLAALPRLAIGDSVIDVAMAVGYDTPSAFAAMFRKFTGTTPARYFSQAPC